MGLFPFLNRDEDEYTDYSEAKDFDMLYKKSRKIFKNVMKNGKQGPSSFHEFELRVNLRKPSTRPDFERKGFIQIFNPDGNELCGTWASDEPWIMSQNVPNFPFPETN